MTNYSPLEFLTITQGRAKTGDDDETRIAVIHSFTKK